MKTCIWILVLATALTAPAPATAQESSGGALASVLQALLLPRTTQEARTLGVPESDIRAILDQGAGTAHPCRGCHRVVRT